MTGADLHADNKTKSTHGAQWPHKYVSKQCLWRLPWLMFTHLFAMDVAETTELNNKEEVHLHLAIYCMLDPILKTAGAYRARAWLFYSFFWEE